MNGYTITGEPIETFVWPTEVKTFQPEQGQPHYWVRCWQCNYCSDRIWGEDNAKEVADLHTC